MPLFLPIRRQQAPSADVGIDWASPYARGLCVAYAPWVRKEVVGGGEDTLVGSAIYNSSQRGPVVESTASTGDGVYFYAQNAAALQTTKQTIMVLARLDSLSAWGALLAYPHVLGTHSSPFHRLSLFQRSTDTVGRFSVSTAGGSFANADSTSGYFTTGTWATYWVVRNGDAVDFIRDFTSYGGSSGTGSTVPGVDTSIPFFLLERNTATGEGMDGAVAVAAIWNRALTTTERRALTLNPWQLFAPVPRRVFAGVPAAGGGATISVPAGSLTLTGNVPTVVATANQWIDVPAGALTLTGYAPTITTSADQVIQVPAGTLTLTGYAPTVVNPVGIAVPAGSLTLTGYEPTVVVNANQFIQVPAGALSLTGFAPTVATTANQFIDVPAGALSLTGYAPTVLGGQVWTSVAGASSVWTAATSASSTWTAN